MTMTRETMTRETDKRDTEKGIQAAMAMRVKSSCSLRFCKILLCCLLNRASKLKQENLHHANLSFWCGFSPKACNVPEREGKGRRSKAQTTIAQTTILSTTTFHIKVACSTESKGIHDGDNGAIQPEGRNGVHA